MKRIGILTFHHVVNWGSALQAYCLYKFIKKVSPFAEVEIIDYIPATSCLYSAQNLPTVAKRERIRNLLKRKNRLDYRSKMRMCNNFIRSNCKLSPISLTSDDLSECKVFLDNLDYDTIVVGSDTVFQLAPNFGTTYISAPQPPNLYFLPFQTDSKKVAISASANPFHPAQLEAVNKEAISNKLNDFDAIYYRDEATKELLSLLEINVPTIGYSPDPSLLIDIDYLSENATILKKPANRFAAVAIGNNTIATAFINLLKQLDYRVLNLLSGPECGQEQLDRLSKFEDFIAIHKNIDLLITDRFHGSIISLLMGVSRIIGIEDASRYPENNSKVRDLYQRLGIENNLYRLHPSEIFDAEAILKESREFDSSKYIDIYSRIQEMRLEAYKLFASSVDFV